MLVAIRRRFLVAAIAAPAAAFTVPTVTAASAPPDITLPAFENSDHAEVIAQSLVTFPDGEHHWQITEHSAALAPSTLTTTGPTFLVTPSGPPVLVASPDGAGWLLDAGQGVFRPGGSTADVSASVEEPATLTQISVEAGGGSDVFTPGASVRDVELWRDVLAPGEGLSLTAEVSAFVLATDGAVDANGTTVPAGVAASFTGELTLQNRTPVPASVVVAVVGPTVGAPPVSSDPPASTEPATTDAPAPTPTSAPAAPPTAAPTTPPTTIDPNLDTDGDGLGDAEEADLGTNPNKFDTDGDGLPDGDDLNSFGCDPTKADTDGDGLTDKLDELDYGLDCSDPDVDGDGFTDGAEIDAGSDPKDSTDHP